MVGLGASTHACGADARAQDTVHAALEETGLPLGAWPGQVLAGERPADDRACQGHCVLLLLLAAGLGGCGCKCNGAAGISRLERRTRYIRADVCVLGTDEYDMVKLRLRGLVCGAEWWWWWWWLAWSCEYCSCLCFRCDRIQWRGDGLQQTFYRRSELKASDHKPGTSRFANTPSELSRVSQSARSSTCK